jgi:hypothetical protein
MRASRKTETRVFLYPEQGQGQRGELGGTNFDLNAGLFCCRGFFFKAKYIYAKKLILHVSEINKQF